LTFFVSPANLVYIARNLSDPSVHAPPTDSQSAAATAYRRLAAPALATTSVLSVPLRIVVWVGIVSVLLRALLACVSTRVSGDSSVTAPPRPLVQTKFVFSAMEDAAREDEVHWDRVADNFALLFNGVNDILST
jgi:hypothetical protein